MGDNAIEFEVETGDCNGESTVPMGVVVMNNLEGRGARRCTTWEVTKDLGQILV